MASLTSKDKREIRDIVMSSLHEYHNMQKPNEDVPIRAEEVAQMTGWKIKTIYCYKEKLGGWNYGRTLFFSKNHILSLIQDAKFK